MAVTGLTHGLAVQAVLTGTVDRFRVNAVEVGADARQVDGAIDLLRLGTAVNTAVAVVAAVLLGVLAWGLFRGGPGARIATWVVCGLGLVCGWATVVGMVAQRRGALKLTGADQPVGELLKALVAAQPGWRVGLTGALAAAQALGYLLVAVLLALPTAGAFYRRWTSSAAATPPLATSFSASPTTAATPLTTAATPPPDSQSDPTAKTTAKRSTP